MLTFSIPQLVHGSIMQSGKCGHCQEPQDAHSGISEEAHSQNSSYGIRYDGCTAIVRHKCHNILRSNNLWSHRSWSRSSATRRRTGSRTSHRVLPIGATHRQGSLNPNLLIFIFRGNAFPARLQPHHENYTLYLWDFFFLSADRSQGADATLWDHHVSMSTCAVWIFYS